MLGRQRQRGRFEEVNNVLLHFNFRFEQRIFTNTFGKDLEKMDCVPISEQIVPIHARNIRVQKSPQRFY
jgi:hypothetical protein